MLSPEEILQFQEELRLSANAAWKMYEQELPHNALQWI